MTNSTLANNIAGNDGGAISNISSTTDVTNCTVSGNTAGIFGGGIYNNNFGNGATGAVTLNNSIVVDSSGGDVKNFATLTANNDLFDLPNAASLAAESIGPLTQSNNVFTSEPLSSILVVDGSGNPMLANNGGPTQTVALVGGSPAIDNGSNALAVDPSTNQTLTTDQAGQSRIENGTGDIGAFEFQYATTTTVALSECQSNLRTGAHVQRHRH